MSSVSYNIYNDGRGVRFVFESDTCINTIEIHEATAQSADGWRSLGRAIKNKSSINDGDVNLDFHDQGRCEDTIALGSDGKFIIFETMTYDKGGAKCQFLIDEYGDAFVKCIDGVIERLFAQAAALEEAEISHVAFGIKLYERDKAEKKDEETERTEDTEDGEEEFEELKTYVHKVMDHFNFKPPAADKVVKEDEENEGEKEEEKKEEFLGTFLEQRTEKVRYKKGAHNEIITLEILGVNNESRSGVFDKMHAVFRCSKARVLDIEHPTKGRVQSAKSRKDKKFVYSIGEVVLPGTEAQFAENHGFNNKEMGAVSDFGIHYFLSREAAESYDGIMFPKFPAVRKTYPEKVIKKWHADGRLKERREVKINGAYHGIQEFWYPNGQLKQRHDINSAVKLKTGPQNVDRGCYTFYERWWPNGRLEERTFYNKGKLHGSSETWYSSGIPKSSVKYVNGKRCGVYTEWHDCGEEKEEKLEKRRIEYDENGEKHGLSQAWYSNGNLDSVIHYKNGKRDGSWKEWYENGSIHTECDYLDGKLIGMRTF